jgi:hypothetical protein
MCSQSFMFGLCNAKEAICCINHQTDYQTIMKGVRVSNTLYDLLLCVYDNCGIRVRSSKTRRVGYDDQYTMLICVWVIWEQLQKDGIIHTREKLKLIAPTDWTGHSCAKCLQRRATVSLIPFMRQTRGITIVSNNAHLGDRQSSLNFLSRENCHFTPILARCWNMTAVRHGVQYHEKQPGLEERVPCHWVSAPIPGPPSKPSRPACIAVSPPTFGSSLKTGLSAV